jgi:hypothetical protein
LRDSETGQLAALAGAVEKYFEVLLRIRLGQVCQVLEASDQTYHR